MNLVLRLNDTVFEISVLRCDMYRIGILLFLNYLLNYLAQAKPPLNNRISVIVCFVVYIEISYRKSGTSVANSWCQLRLSLALVGRTVHGLHVLLLMHG